MGKENKKVSLLSRWKNKKKDGENVAIVKKAPEGAVIPLSSGQQRLWFLQQVYQDNPFYNYSEYYSFKGKLQIAPLKNALELIFKEQETLWSYYPLDNGAPILKIDTSQSLKISEYDFSDLTEQNVDIETDLVMSACAKTSFHLSKPPLFKILLIKLPSERFVLFITMHHIITDIWSMEIFSECLTQYYNFFCEGANPEPKQLKIQFADYSYWQKQKSLDQDQLGYWKKKLSGQIPILNLQTDYERPLRPSFKGSQNTVHYPENLSRRILELAAKLEVTPYVLLLSVYYVMLFRHSGQNDICIGSPISNRSQKSLEGIFGFFIETVVLRYQINTTQSFAQFVKGVHENTFEAFSNKDIPFDVLVKELRPERSMTINPFFQAMFLYHSQKELPFFGNDVQLIEYSEYDTGVSKFDLTLNIKENKGKLSSTFEYDIELFEETTINRFQEHYQLLLQGVIAEVDSEISKIEMLSVKEKELLIPNSNLKYRSYGKHLGIHNFIEEVAEKIPDQVALIFGNRTMTYGDLNESANVMAEAIWPLTKGKNEVIGVCLDRSLNMITAILAILKSGCAYLPLDPEYPSHRLDFMLVDSKAVAVLVDHFDKHEFNSFKGETLVTDALHMAVGTKAKIEPSTSLADWAYVIYTSGSTGKPKGVPITHGNIINSTLGRLDFYPENPKAFLLMSSISFDSSKAGIFWTLCTGGTLVIAEKHLEQDIEKIGNTISTNSITHTLLLPSLYHLILEHSDTSILQSLKTVMVAGESCLPQLRKAHFEKLPKVALYNEYGPTEATVWCIAHKVKETDRDRVVPIGTPVANAKIYLLDENHELVPQGAAGEIYISGPGLTPHYLNRSELTSKAFIENPLEEISNERLYKTGDLGRYNNQGQIIFLGRVDEQVKIRGFRIELGEIEKALVKQDNISRTVVTVETSARNTEEEYSVNAPNLEKLAEQIILNLDAPVFFDILNSINSSVNDARKNGITKTFLKAIMDELSDEEYKLLYQKIKPILVDKTKKTKDGPKLLIAYIETLENNDIENLKKNLRIELPEYMVPSIIHKMDSFPVLPNGKVDKAALREIRYADLQKESSISNHPVNEMERKLVSIWEEVLNFSPIAIHDNFFEIGGDSISSIQIIAKARNNGILISGSQIFENQTISELALFAKSDEKTKYSEETLEGEVPMTPIQHWFFDTHTTAPHYWNQIVKLSVSQPTEADYVKDIVKELISHHDALRLSFFHRQNKWIAKVLPLEDNEVFHHIKIDALTDISSQNDHIYETLRKFQQRCNLSEGRLFRAFYFDCGIVQEDAIFIIAHHLIIDMISWNSIFEDISTALRNNSLKNKISLKTKTDSIKAWGNYLQELSKSEKVLGQLPFWEAQKNDDKPFPRDFEVKNKVFREKSIEIYQSILEPAETSILIDNAHITYNTKIEDLLITALLMTICPWANLDRLCLGLERHGRHILGSTLDVSNTVGWLTSYFPINLKNYGSNDLGAKIKSVKEQLRSIPDHGAGYGILKYLSKEPFDRTFLNQSPQLILNYLGIQHANRTDADTTFEYITTNYRHPDSERTYALEINAYVLNDRLCMNWSYTVDVYRKITIEGLAEKFTENLKEVIAHCTNQEQGNYTPSDFPEAEISQDDLDNLMGKLYE